MLSECMYKTVLNPKSGKWRGGPPREGEIKREMWESITVWWGSEGYPKKASKWEYTCVLVDYSMCIKTGNVQIYHFYNNGKRTGLFRQSKGIFILPTKLFIDTAYTF